MNRLKQKLLAPCIALGIFLISSPALGFTFTTAPNSGNYGNPDATNLLTVGMTTSDVSKTFKLNYLIPGLSSLGNALSATANLELTGFSYTEGQTLVTLFVQLSNNIANLSDTARITSFGLVLDPNATGASIDNPTGPFNSIDNGALPAFSVINQCAFGGSNCQGGGNSTNSINAGEVDHFTLTFSYSGDVTGQTINMSQFPIKWQSALGGCSYETSPSSYVYSTNVVPFASYGPADSTSCGTTSTPEPNTTLLLFGGLSLMLIGYRKYII